MPTFDFGTELPFAAINSMKSKLRYLEYFCGVPLVVVGPAFEPDNFCLPLVSKDLDEHSGIGASEHHISSHYRYLIVNHWKI